MTRRGYALLAASVAAFTIYGSLVPFQPRPPDEVELALARAQRSPFVIDSRSDLIANVMLGIPLSFSILGALHGSQTSRARTALLALAIWPVCISFAAAVEYSQLYFRERDSSPTDVLAQTAGSLVGVLAWLLAGPKITTSLHRLKADHRTGGIVGRILLFYLVGILFIQLLPWDFTVSPGRIYHKIRDREWTLTPFSELFRTDGSLSPDLWGKIQTWLGLFALYFPAGLLSAQLPGRQWRSGSRVPIILLAGLGIGVLFEFAQFTVSRHPSSTDAIIATGGVLVGWCMSRKLLRFENPAGLGLEWTLILGQAWCALLILAFWAPFQFEPRIEDLSARLRVVNWIPLADLGTKNYLSALDSALIRAIMFLPLGVLFAAHGPRSSLGLRHAFAAALGVLFSLIFETGQLFLHERYPSATDLLLAGLGSWIGFFATTRIREINSEQNDI